MKSTHYKTRTDYILRPAAAKTWLEKVKLDPTPKKIMSGKRNGIAQPKVDIKLCPPTIIKNNNSHSSRPDVFAAGKKDPDCGESLTLLYPFIKHFVSVFPLPHFFWLGPRSSIYPQKRGRQINNYILIQLIYFHLRNPEGKQSASVVSETGNPFFANLIFPYQLSGPANPKVAPKNRPCCTYTWENEREKKKFAKLTCFRPGLITFFRLKGFHLIVSKNSRCNIFSFFFSLTTPSFLT